MSLRYLVPIVLVGLCLLVPTPTQADEGPRQFATPELAARALVEAATKGRAALLELWGEEHEELVGPDGDPASAERRAQFVAAARRQLSLREMPNGERVVVVGRGRNAWSLPIPLVRHGRRWSFDARQGKAEILARIVGENEREALRICRVYPRAQQAYAQHDRDGDGVREFAQRLVSEKDTRDGLYWPPKQGEVDSPLEALIAPARAFLDERYQDEPWRGYHWRILTAQGPSAPGGRMDYLVEGDMRRGFALIGVPARYRVSGVMTFLVGPDGRIHQKDLGTKTSALAAKITRYNPSAGWRRVD